MPIRLAVRLALATAFACAAAGPAGATPVRIDFHGTFTASLDPDGLLDGIDLGTAITGFVEYDTSWPQGVTGDYYSSPTTAGRIRLVFSGGTTTRAGEVRITVQDDVAAGDQLTVYSGFPPTGAFFSPTQILRFDQLILSFIDPTGAAFSNRSLPANLPPGTIGRIETSGCIWTASTQFGYCDIFSGPQFLATFTIDSFTMVPEPAGAALLALGTALLARLRSHASSLG